MPKRLNPRFFANVSLRSASNSPLSEIRIQWATQAIEKGDRMTRLFLIALGVTAIAVAVMVAPDVKRYVRI